MKTSRCLLCFFLLASGVACQKSSSERVYQEIHIASPQAPMADPHAMMNMGMDSNMMMAPSSDAEKLSWETPPSWQEQKGSGMRVVTFTAGETAENKIECTIVSLGSEAKDVKSNVVRWLGQLGITLSDDELRKFLSAQENFSIQGEISGKFLNFTQLQDDQNSDVPSMLAAMLEAGTQVIFVKMTGSKSAVLNQKEAFENLCRSIKSL